jgi:hypothetical protein
MRGMIFFTPFVILLIVIFGIIMIAPLVVGKFFPVVELLIKGYFALIIIMFVRNILGGGVLGYGIGLVLVYIFVVRVYPIFAAGYMLYLVMAFGLSSVIFFGFQGLRFPKLRGRR